MAATIVTGLFCAGAAMLGASLAGGSDDPPPIVTAASLSKVVTNAYMMVGQDCSVMLAADQSLVVVGSGNIVSGVTMAQTVQFNLNCVTFSQSDTSVQNNIVSAIAQSMDLDLTGHDPEDGADMNTIIANAVCNNFYNCTFVNCAQSINVNQTLKVIGTGNVVTDVVMEQSVDAIANCLLASESTNTALTSIANTISQQMQIQSTGGLVGLTDSIGNAIDGLLDGIIGILIVAVVLVVVIVIAFVAVGKIGKKGTEPAPAYADPYAPVEPEVMVAV